MSAPFQLEAYLNRDNLPAGSEVDVFLMVRARPTKEAAAAVQNYRRKVHMAFVIDASGSMCGEKIETAKEAIIRRYQRDLDDDDMLSLITFSRQRQNSGEFSHQEIRKERGGHNKGRAVWRRD